MSYTPFLTWNLHDIPSPTPTESPTLPSEPTNSLIDGSIDSFIDNPPSYESDDELPKAVRIELAHQAWIREKSTLKIKDVARRFGVAYSTLNDRIHGAVSKELANQAMQSLSVADEEAMRDWLLDLASWGWLMRAKTGDCSYLSAACYFRPGCRREGK